VAITTLKTALWKKASCFLFVLSFVIIIFVFSRPFISFVRRNCHVLHDALLDVCTWMMLGNEFLLF
jgi:hypothetical protein